MSIFTQHITTSYIELDQNARVSLIECLNQALVTGMDLKNCVKYAHWNIRAPHFYQLHELFDKLAHDLEEHNDDLAERIKVLGGMAQGTSNLVSQYSIFTEYPTSMISWEKHMKELLNRYTAFIRFVRQSAALSSELNDDSTADLFTEISRSIEKSLWFIESHL